MTGSTAIPPAPISHANFDFYPTVPAASYPAASYAPPVAGQTASAALSNERYRVDPSVSLNGGELHSGAISGGRHYLPEESVQLQTGTSRIIDFATKLRRVSIADTTVADIQVINPFQINLIGHKPGFTTLAIWDQSGQYQERPIRIDPNGKQQVLLSTMVAELDRSAVENQGTNLSAALSHAGVSLVGLPGAVATPFSGSSSVTSSSGVVTSVNESLEPGGSLTDLILSQGMTYGLALGNSNYQVQGFFQYLEDHQLAKILAQPHLLANSGEEAKFLSGGEIPIVVAQALNTSIVFKQFGTSVEFVPTVVGRDDIELLVKPEVSEPDFAEGVELFGFTVPAFVTRRAETMVQLKDNQTLIIAGLILHEKKTQIQKVPYLGDMPYLGGLFRNTSYSNTETDLVMSVTPQIVQPLPDGASVYNPTAVPDLTTEQIETRRLAQPDATRPRF
jgi:pilus assembly protein CpaC